MITETLEVDYTLVQMLIKTIKDGSIDQIKNYIERYGLDVKIIRDTQLDQNCLFFCTLIKDNDTALQALELFVERGVDPNQKDKINQTCLYYAARESKFSCCKFLLEKGVPVNEQDVYLQTPIYYAAREGATQICELFVNAGADVNIEDKYGQTCLYYAIKQGKEETVEFLIKSGADVNKLDKKKISCYHHALKNDKPNIAEILVKYGASTEIYDPKKAKQKQKHDYEEKDKEVNRYKKAFLIKINEDGKTRLTNEEMQAFEEEYKEIIELLNDKEALENLEKEADERLFNTEGWEKTSKKVLNILWKMGDASIFHRPVDPIELGIPDYTIIIKNPMDFGTIKKKLNSGYYVNFCEFDEDINLVFHNCILYNGVSYILIDYYFYSSYYL